MTPIDGPPLTPIDTEKLMLAITPDVHVQSTKLNGGADFGFAYMEKARFRVSVLKAKGNYGLVLRQIPNRMFGLRDIGLPDKVRELLYRPRGLILVTGPTGSGKSTTLASMINYVNENRDGHIITIEDPIEYEHAHMLSLVEQVEVGTDAPDFPTALRAALRQAPDVVVVGEMRDPETMRIAMAAAETGHLVFSTLHTTDVASTVSRIADSFPPERQNTIRQEMAMALTAVLTQMLLPSKRGGRVPAAELLMFGYGARQHIRRNALQHLHQEITITKKAGSFSLEESLAQIVAQGHIDRETAMLSAIHPDDLEIFLKPDGRG
jgi:twitching motility protein PilT